MFHEQTYQKLHSRLKEVSGGCVEWLGATTTAGYGQIYDTKTKKVQYTHRIAYTEKKGKIPKGLTIDHLCRNTLCVNPDHLDCVTLSENARRGAIGTKQSKKTIEKRVKSLRKNFITFKGETLCLMDWSRKIGVSYGALTYRHKNGWPKERLLSTNRYNRKV